MATDMVDEVEELPAVISVNFGVKLSNDSDSLNSVQVAATPTTLSPSPPPVQPDVLKRSTGRSVRNTIASLVFDIGRQQKWSTYAQAWVGWKYDEMAKISENSMITFDFWILSLFKDRMNSIPGVLTMPVDVGDAVAVATKNRNQGPTWPKNAEDPDDFSQFFGGLAQGSEDDYMAGLSCWRLIQTILTVHVSSVMVGLFFAISLASSGIWPVPGHKQATLWTGLLNRLVWSLSPVFLGGFFPGFCSPELMRNWRVHRYFVIISLLPFILADVAFPYIVGTDTHLKVSQFETCQGSSFSNIFSIVNVFRQSTCCQNKLFPQKI